MDLKLSNILKFISIISVFGLVFFVSGSINVEAVDQSRSEEFFAGAFPTQVTSATSSDFIIYIGNSLNGVTDPVKSAYFRVSGVYTGAGSLELKIDDDAATAKTFDLPDVTSATAFEFLYHDDSGKINPASAGEYAYTLDFNPSGTVAISGLSARAEITYQFAETACPDGSAENEKTKHQEFFAAGYASQVSTATSAPFTFYIGDNLEGVTSTIKSLYFKVSGTYTGAGSLEMKIDDDAATAKTFDLPSVTSPTAFEFLYKDDSGKINPASAGEYAYTLNFNPSGTVAISGLAAKLSETHRYKPPACGGAYPADGYLTSAVFDTTGEAGGPAYNSIMWQGTLGNGTEGKVNFQLATSDSESGPWTFYGGATCAPGDWFSAGPNSPMEIGCFSQFNNKRFFKYKTRICSSADCSTMGSFTPQIDEVVVSWSP